MFGFEVYRLTETRSLGEMVAQGDGQNIAWAWVKASDALIDEYEANGKFAPVKDLHKMNQRIKEGAAGWFVLTDYVVGVYDTSRVKSLPV